MLKTRVPIFWIFLLVGFLGGFVLAGRNAGGSYTLPAGNPVVTGTTIQSTWANNTLNDVATEMTNSLDRQGRGGMLAPLQLTSGTLVTPGLNWVIEPGSGLYRAGAGDIRYGVAGTGVLKLQSALVSTLVPLTVTGRTTTTDLTVTGSSRQIVISSAAASSATAILATGDLGGFGILATGGASNAPGVKAQGGGATGIGVQAFGGTSGVGVDSTGGTAAAGVIGRGGAGGPGVAAVPGTSATGAVPQDAIVASNGYLYINATSPSPATPTPNRLSAKNITQAWASVGFDNGSVFFIDDSYGFSAIIEQNTGSCTNFSVKLTLDSTFPLATSGQPAYAAIAGDRSPTPGAGTAKCRPVVVSKATTFILVQFVDTTTGLQCSKCGVGTSMQNVALDLTVLGAY